MCINTLYIYILYIERGRSFFFLFFFCPMEMAPKHLRFTMTKKKQTEKEKAT